MREFDIPAVVAAMSQLRENKAKVFGSDGHRFRLNPVFSESEAVAFERHHRILLPADYRQFITKLGNGGAGPFYGVFPLGFVDHDFDERPWHENDGFVGTLSKPFPHHGEWNDLTGQPADDLLRQDENEYWRQTDKFEERYWSSELVNGAFPICHEGCALRIWLVVTGEQAGTLWEDRRSEFAGLRPVQLCNGLPATFSEWYKEWLDECFATAGQVNWR